MGDCSQTGKKLYKEEIMMMYLNKFEFINGAHGIEAAAQIYFNKKQDSLSIDEAATLIGMLKIRVFTIQNVFLKNVKKGEIRYCRFCLTMTILINLPLIHCPEKY